jgi:hypothetical protein
MLMTKTDVRLVASVDLAVEPVGGVMGDVDGAAALRSLRVHALEFESFKARFEHTVPPALGPTVRELITKYII